MKAFLKKNLKFLFLILGIGFFATAAIVWFANPDSPAENAEPTSALVANTARPVATEIPSRVPAEIPTQSPEVTATPDAADPGTSDPGTTQDATATPDGQVFVTATDLTPEDTPIPTSVPTADPNELAPDFEAIDLAGNTVMLSSYFGRPIIIYFWATWCNDNQSDLPGFNDAYHRHGDKVQFLLVNLTDGIRDTESGVKKYLSDRGYDFPVLLDTRSSALGKYQVHSLPLTVMINPDGTEKSRRMGTMDAMGLEGYVREMIIEAGLSDQ